MSIKNIGKYCNVSDWYARGLDESNAIIEGYSEEGDYYVLGVMINGSDYDDEIVPAKCVVDIGDGWPAPLSE